MTRSAVIYLVNGRIIVAPVVRTTTGLGLEVEPILLDESNEEGVAQTLANALALSDRVVAHPSQSEWKGSFKPFLDAAGVRSHKAFMKDARQVSVEVIDGQLKFIPHRNLGAKDGFEPMSDDTVHVPDGDWSGAAATLLRLLPRP